VPTLLGVFSSVAWAFGAVMQRRFAASDLIQMSAMQMLVAAAVLATVALGFGERLAVDQFTPTALGGFLYPIFFGSIVGFSAFLWLMNNVPDDARLDVLVRESTRIDYDRRSAVARALRLAFRGWRCDHRVRRHRDDARTGASRLRC
jgi:hypothetical protein